MSDTLSGPDAGPDGPAQPLPSAAAGRPGGPGGLGGGGPSPVLAALARARMQPPPSQPGMGTQGGALQKIAMAVELLTQALPALPQGSTHRRSVLTALTHLDRGGKDMPQGAQQTAIGDMMRNQQRNAMLARIMAQRQGGPQGMPPSTPMPGA